MVEEIYLGKRMEIPIVLRQGYSGDFQFVILTVGTHPCAYVGVNKKHKLFGLDYDELYEENRNIECHGGMTYASDHISQVKNMGKRWWFGWDYGHYGDFHDSNLYRGILEGFGGDRRWLLDEIYIEVLEVMKQLEELK